VAVASSSAEASSDSRRFRESTAFYAKDETKGEVLAACLDIDIIYKTEEAANAKREKMKKSNEELLKKDPKGVMVLPESCAKTFADHEPLASCAQEFEPKDPVESGSTTHYIYMYEFLSGDGAQHDCLSKKGKWTAMDRKSAEFLAAQSEAELRKADFDMKKLQKQLGQ